uniref:Uncharacterized protein n=1 Tax=Anopheles coluzzii TaxID=1518534 RepID=A0A8W7PRZ0_ANOCL
MPVGNVSYYHRRKYSPQAPPDHQSRIFFGDYARPDGGSERSRSNGSISSVATTQSSSSCVSVHSSAASLADAANANLLAVVSAPQGVESDSSPVPKCVDSAGSCGGGGGIGTTTTTTTTTTSSGSNCCVRAAAAAGESGSVGASQQVPSSRTSGSGLLAGGSLAPGGTSYSQASSSTFGTSRLGSNEEQRSQLSPGKYCILSMLCCVKIRRSYFDKMLIISYRFQ